MTKYPKRLIEVDLPIKKISAHARREKSIRHGHISTLHIWWARRPLAACRAVICAALWLDPGDPDCPIKFKTETARLMKAFRDKRGGKSYDWNDGVELRKSLLEFIADFANWDNSTNKDFLETSRALTQVAHESLGGEPGTRPLVVDPFAGGGSIPLEALRVGADAFASDLNPVAVLLNKVVLEYIPKYGQNLADEVRKWGYWILDEANKILSEYYPAQSAAVTPLAYIWAHTIRCEGPNCGVKLPLMRSLWLAKKGKNSVAIKIIPDSKNKELKFEIISSIKSNEIKDGTVKEGAATCPLCGYTTPITSVKKQFRNNQTTRTLYCVIDVPTDGNSKIYRLPTDKDLTAVKRAERALEEMERNSTEPLSLYPNEDTTHYHSFVNRAAIYGLTTWDKYYTRRQLLMLVVFSSLVKKACQEISAAESLEYTKALRTCLSILVSRLADFNSALCALNTTGGRGVVHTFGRQALPMVWDFAESNPLNHIGANWEAGLKAITKFIEDNKETFLFPGVISESDAAEHVLPNDSVNAFITDPPYYYAMQYADLSDFFYGWLKRLLFETEPTLFLNDETPKDNEIIVQSPSDVDKPTGKNRKHYETRMELALREGVRILKPDGIGTIVFAHKSTEGWESLLNALITAGWIVTASWPIDTERPGRVISIGRAMLGSSVHIVCRPRENPDGSLRTDDIGDWRDVLVELPKRIHEWMPRLAKEGVVGADAIFACLGPALEIFSRYSRVEKASGEIVPLKEYLEYVWAAVAKEALNMIFEGAETTGFEEDARLTAMWLWTLSTGTNGNGNGKENPPSSPFSKGGINQDPTLAKGGKGGFEEDNEIEDDETDIEDSKTQHSKLPGYTLEYDAARKIAQGLGAHLEKLQSLVEVKGDKARLLPVAERTRALFGKDEATAPKAKKKKKEQMSMFAEIEEAEESDTWGADTLLSKGFRRVGNTTLDRLHQSMILFATGRGEALKRFLVEEGVGRDERFWRLAQAFSALYPKNTDEKRWVDGVLARKKGLGL